MNISKLNYFFTIIVLSNISFFIGANYFPDENWNSASPESQGIASSKVKKLIDLTFLDDATQGVVIIKNGVIVGEKYADSHNMLSHGTSWSMAKSYYAALIGISIEKGEIQSLDDPVVKYLDYFNDERKNITIRDLLDMSSGLEFPDHEHEKMFFSRKSPRLCEIC
jgi:CubicO group peptidase (beta-lactamase class C family)